METAPALAAEIARHFPELNGRAFAVSEVDPFDGKTHRPTLPVAIVGLANENGTQQANGGGNITIAQGLVVQFIFEPVKYRSADGQETPFFAYYNFEAVRDKMLGLTQYWRTPRNGGLSYVSLDVTSDEYAVYVTFRFTTSEKWCAPDPAECETSAGGPVMIIDNHTLHVRVLQAEGCCPPEPCPEPADPCDAARERNPQGINDKPGPPFAWDK